MYEVRVKNPEVEFVVSIVKIRKDAMALISRNLKNCGVTPPYYRSWSKDDGKTINIDYGSHSDFFILKKIKENT